MTALCHSLPASHAENLLQLTARAICDRLGETRSQGEGRTRQLVHTTLGFEPRDGLEYILAMMVFAHFNLILEAMRDVFQGQLEGTKLRTISGIVALDRAMMTMIRQMRTERKRPLAAARASDQASDQLQAAPVAVVQPGEAPSVPPLPPAACAVAPAKSGPLPGLPTQKQQDASRAALILVAPASPRPSVLASTSLTPAKQVFPLAPMDTDPDEGTFEEHLAAFHQALAEAKQTLAETSAYARVIVAAD